MGVFAWTTTMRLAKFAASFATPATSWWGIAGTGQTCSGGRSFTSDEVLSITPVGREEVFDLQVEDTGNFIADGLVSHNTRWHEDDLGGRLLERQKGLWEVLNLPAQAYDVDPDTGLIPPDPLGREPGQWLWGDDGYGYGEALKIIKREYEQAGAMRDWQALYQGRPTAGEGTVFKVAGLSVIDEEPVATPNVVRAWDLAATKKMGTADPDWTVGLKLMRTREDGYVILDVERLRGGPEDVERAIMDTAKRDGKRVAISLPQDPGQAGKSQALQLTKKLAGYRVTATVESGDKATRAAPAAAQVNIGNVAMLRGSWNAPLRAELAAFPGGTHDDMVDAFSRAFSMVALNRPLVVSNEALRDLKYGLRQGYQPRR
jgi:predicted phage terminase large subunit-like protein